MKQDINRYRQRIRSAKFERMALGFLLLLGMLVSVASAYTNQQYNFSVQIPEGWKVDDQYNRQVPTRVVQIFDLIHTWKSVEIYVVRKGTTSLKRMVQNQNHDFQTEAPDFTVVAESTMKIQGSDAIVNEATMTYQGISLREKVVYIEDPHYFYGIILIVTKADYQSTVPLFDSMIATLALSPYEQESATPSQTVPHMMVSTPSTPTTVQTTVETTTIPPATTPGRQQPGFSGYIGLISVCLVFSFILYNNRRR